MSAPKAPRRRKVRTAPVARQANRASVQGVPPLKILGKTRTEVVPLWTIRGDTDD